MQLPGKRKHERPKSRYLDVVKEDMQEVGAIDGEVFDRSVWRIYSGDPCWESRKKKCCLKQKGMTYVTDPRNNRIHVLPVIREQFLDVARLKVANLILRQERDAHVSSVHSLRDEQWRRIRCSVEHNGLAKQRQLFCPCRTSNANLFLTILCFTFDHYFIVMPLAIKHKNKCLVYQTDDMALYQLYVILLYIIR